MVTFSTLPRGMSTTGRPRSIRSPLVGAAVAICATTPCRAQDALRVAERPSNVAPSSAESGHRAREDSVARTGAARATALTRVTQAAHARGVHVTTRLIVDASEYRRHDGRWSGAGRTLGSITIGASLDSLVGWRGARWMMGLLSFAGPDQTGTLRSINGGTSIDAAPFRGVGELWLEQRVGERMRLKVGRMDVNTEFAVARHASSFLRPGSGLDPTLAIVAPTYPLPALAANAVVQVTPGLALRGGIFDGHPTAALATSVPRTRVRDNLFAIGELELRGGETRLALGHWQHTGDFARLVPTRQAGDRGVRGLYAMIDRTLWRAAGDDERQIGAFAQAGWATPLPSDVARHASVGVSVTGPSRRRAADQAGIAVSVVALGEAGAQLRHARAGAREELLELFYAVRVASWLAVVPDVKVIFRPGGASAGPASAFTLRLDVSR